MCNRLYNYLYIAPRGWLKMRSASQLELLSELDGDQYLDDSQNVFQQRDQSISKTINAIIKVQDVSQGFDVFLGKQTSNLNDQLDGQLHNNNSEAMDNSQAACGGGELELHSTHGVCTQCGQPLLQSNLYFALLYRFTKAETHFSRQYFTELGVIGSGSFGTVYRVQHHIQDIAMQSYAIKKIAVGNSRPWLLKVLQEVNILQRLHHPNVVRYHHCWLEKAQTAINLDEEIEHLHILLEYAKGGSLSNLRPSILGRSLTEEEFLHLLLGACRGLNHLHSLQVLSRDVKLQNFLLTGDILDEEPKEYIHQIYGQKIHNEQVIRAQKRFKNDSVLQNQSRQKLFIRNSGISNLRVMLTDFGQVGDGVSAGTEMLLAPEVFLLQKHSEKSDIFSLGLTFMQLIIEGEVSDNSNEELEIMQQGAKQYQKWLIKQMEKSNVLSNKTKQFLFMLVHENPIERPTAVQCEQIILQFQQEFQKRCKEIMIYSQNNKGQPFIYEDLTEKQHQASVNPFHQLNINKDGALRRQIVLTEKYTYVQLYLIIVTTLSFILLLMK